MIRILLIFTYVCFIINLAHSQNQISGKIYSTDGNPSVYIQVALLNSDSTLTDYSITDSLGVFIFKNIDEGNYFLSLGKTIHSKISVIYKDKTHLDLGNFTFEKKAIELNELKVIGKKSWINKDLDKLIVNISNIELARGKTILDLLQYLPGIKSDGSTISLNGRGSPLFLIDGKPASGNISSSYTILKNMSAENFESVEIMSIPSAKYDAAGSGGVLNLITKKNSSFSEIRLSSSSQLFPLNNLSGLQYNNKGMGTNLLFSTGKFKNNLSADYNLNNSFQKSYSERNFIDDTPSLIKENTLHNKGKSVTSRLASSYDFSKNFFIDGYTSIISSGPNNANNFEEYIDNRKTEVHFNTKLTMLNYGFGGTHNLKNKNKIYWGLDGNTLRNSNTSRFNLFDENTNQIDFQNERKFNINLISYKTDLNLKIGNLPIDAGLKLTTQKYKSNIKILSNNESDDLGLNDNKFNFIENIYAGYLTSRKKWSKNQIQIGTRIESTSSNYESNSNGNFRNFNVFPNFNYQYSISNQESLNFSYGKRIRRPNFEDYNTNLIFNVNSSSIIIGDTNIRPQISNVIDLSYTKNDSYFLFSASNTDDAKTSVIRNDGLIQVIERVNVKGSNSFYFLYSNKINLIKGIETYLNSSINYSKMYLLDNGKSSTLYGDLSLRTAYRWKKNSLNYSIIYSTPYVSYYTKVNSSLRASLSYNLSISKQLNFSVNVNDIFGLGIPQMKDNFDNQQIITRLIANQRSIGLSLRYRFKTGIETRLRNRPNINNGELRNN